MSNIKEKMTGVIQSQPDDATYEEIMRELAFERMVERGLADSRNGRTITNQEMERRIRTWQK
jgi:predicted transcriptional regulator